MLVLFYSFLPLACLEPVLVVVVVERYAPVIFDSSLHRQFILPLSENGSWLFLAKPFATHGPHLFTEACDLYHRWCQLLV